VIGRGEEWQSAQELNSPVKRQVPSWAIHLLESAPRESFTDAHENMPDMPKDLPG
jgi:hypothetical protein